MLDLMFTLIVYELTSISLFVRKVNFSCFVEILKSDFQSLKCWVLRINSAAKIKNLISNPKQDPYNSD